MANKKLNRSTYKGVIIDTAPGAGGYWTDPVRASDHKIGAMYLTIAGIFAGTVTLQFRTKAFQSWTPYDSYTDTTRQIIEDYSDTEWRAGMTSGSYTSGAARIAIDYHNGEVI